MLQPGTCIRTMKTLPLILGLSCLLQQQQPPGLSFVTMLSAFQRVLGSIFSGTCVYEAGELHTLYLVRGAPLELWIALSPLHGEACGTLEAAGAEFIHFLLL